MQLHSSGGLHCRQKELAKVPVEAADIELIAAEMNLSKADAEQALRENEVRRPRMIERTSVVPSLRVE